MSGARIIVHRNPRTDTDTPHYATTRTYRAGEHISVLAVDDLVVPSDVLLKMAQPRS